MGELIDKAKGKAKQVQGIITGDKALKREGEIDEAKGEVKGVVNKAASALHNAVDSVKNTVKKA